MRLTKTLFVAAFAFVCSIGMKAQSCCEGGAESMELGYKPYPYWFVQVQGGVNTVFTDVPFYKHLQPTFSLGIGRMFTPIIGARLHFNGIQTTGAFDKMTGPTSTLVAGRDIASNAYNWELIGDPLKYTYKYLTSDVDLMVNIFNIFSKKVHRPVDLYLIGGLGLSYAWANDDFSEITQNYSVANDISNAWGPDETPRQSLLSHNLRVGLLLDWNFAKHWAVGIEADLNSLDDRFNSKYKNSDDWMLTAQLSLTYKFGFKPCCQKPVEPAPIIVEPEPEPVLEVVPEPEPEPEPIVVETKEPLKEVIFYKIRENEPNPDAIMDKVVAWSKKYPEGKITISGYADKGTGNPQLNVGYAQRRADSVLKQLKEKGVPASQMTSNSYGDKVQPFEDNDKNRCVIILGTFE